MVLPSEFLVSCLRSCLLLGWLRWLVLFVGNGTSNSSMVLLMVKAAHRNKRGRHTSAHLSALTGLARRAVYIHKRQWCFFRYVSQEAKCHNIVNYSLMLIHNGAMHRWAIRGYLQSAEDLLFKGSLVVDQGEKNKRICQFTKTRSLPGSLSDVALPILMLISSSYSSERPGPLYIRNNLTLCSWPNKNVAGHSKALGSEHDVPVDFRNIVCLSVFL